MKWEMLIAVWLAAVNYHQTPYASSAPIVWSGLTTSFSKPPFADPSDSANQDRITASVTLTRGAVQGIYNVAQEGFFTPGASPQGTAWATSINNPGKTIASSNWADLSFSDWQTAYGSFNSLATNITRLGAVVHLISDDIYLDLKFTDWGIRSGSGAGFSYLRSSIPEPSTVVLLTLTCTPLLSVGRSTRG